MVSASSVQREFKYENEEDDGATIPQLISNEFKNVKCTYITRDANDFSNYITRVRLNSCCRFYTPVQTPIELNTLPRHAEGRLRAMKFTGHA